MPGTEPILTPDPEKAARLIVETIKAGMSTNSSVDFVEANGPNLIIVVNGIEYELEIYT